ncbi:MAG: lysyl-tRNA synthetase class II [bacterium]|nr:MAG: lysyl-tRNA synthetase class II [bacterium]
MCDVKKNLPANSFDLTTKTNCDNLQSLNYFSLRGERHKMDEQSQLILQRVKKIEELRRDGINPYTNNFKVTHVTQDILEEFKDKGNEDLEKVKEKFSLAGRIMAIRNFGRAIFLHMQDRKGKIQAYIRQDLIGKENFRISKKFDIGDFIGICGKPFRTKTQELTVYVDEVKLLTKALRPLPEKWHGLVDIETRYRQRYLDLIVNPQAREILYKRTRIIQLIREFLNERDFLEVETPMMQSIPGGATARPFKTYHNTLGMDLYLRIAPELYLKRLVIGGLERVYEINRNFRNEGISTQHNPEFTMLEFYQSYATYLDFMDLTEELLTRIARALFNSLEFEYQGVKLDFTPPWRRLTIKEAIIKHSELKEGALRDKEKLMEYGQKIGLQMDRKMRLGNLLIQIFEEVAEPNLIQPTFITHYPTDTSPLSRRNDENPDEVDRFELFICGREIANAFSELNDPIDQKERFLTELRQKGETDNESGMLDKDFIKALEYGMPPTAGEGIGIDRLVMLFTDAASIRDVILFPQLRSRE